MNVSVPFPITVVFFPLFSGSLFFSTQAIHVRVNHSMSSLFSLQKNVNEGISFLTQAGTCSKESEFRSMVMLAALLEIPTVPEVSFGCLNFLLDTELEVSDVLTANI